MTTEKTAILCIDVDGTLINVDEKIHPYDVALLQNFPREIQPVLTTGRSLHGARAVLRQNGVFENTLLPLPGVFMNGGAAYLPGEVFCTKHTFSPHINKTLIDLSVNYTAAAFTFFTLEKVFLVNPNPFARHISDLHFLNAIEVNPKNVPDGVIKLMILDQNPNNVAHIKTQTADWDVEGAYSLPYAFEINPPGITKANTLGVLLKAMDMEGLPIYTVGDGENDLSLFRLSQKSFARDSTHQIILKAADQIIERKKDGLLGPILEQIHKSLYVND